MQSSDIRRRFLEHFGSRGHTVVPSSPLVPLNDPTLFFANSGMVQFKDAFTGQDVRPYRRATTVQKCLRVSGKHNDLEVVGRTPRHHTFFEMLGNFSFGDYFKKEAIAFAWELLTGVFGIPAERLWVTVYEKDDEAWDLWSAIPTLREGHLQRLGMKDNFWAAGDTGPCGPCSEIFFDHGPERGASGGPASESDRYVEIWNLVFMQFERAADGTTTPLPRPSIDTGMGLERVAAVLQGHYSNYDTDVLAGLVKKAALLGGVTLGKDSEADVALRVIADHSRATAFLVADGVMPSNVERGYVLRRVMRRAIRYGVKIGLEDAFLFQTVDEVIRSMGVAYPELVEKRDFVLEVVKGEEESFATTRDHGLALLSKEFEGLAKKDQRVLPGDVAFKLYDTYGFPLDLTELIASERGFSVDQGGYDTKMEEQRVRSQSAWKGSGDSTVGAVFHELRTAGLTTRFLGYADDSATSTITALLRGDARVEALNTGDEGFVLTDASPFYAESGGQVGDTGTLQTDTGRADVLDTQKKLDALWLHRVRVVEGLVKGGQAVRLQVDGPRRNRTRLHHTATHLLHAALRTVLGDHVQQKGSLVAPDRLRFDFSHHKALTADELVRVEDIVYAEVLKNTALQVEEMGIDAAKAKGAMALFGEKYGDRVRVVEVPGASVELCGGTHVGRTGDIGFFKIVGEAGVASGVRRIEALTGPSAQQWVRTQTGVLDALVSKTNRLPQELGAAIDALESETKRLSRELAKAKQELGRAAAGDLLSQAQQVGDVRVLAADFPGDRDALRAEADRLRDQLGSSVVVLGSVQDGAVVLVATVSKDLAGKRLHAGKLVGELSAALGGKGGGRPEFAQGGGKDAARWTEVLATVQGVVASALG